MHELLKRKHLITFLPWIAFDVDPNLFLGLSSKLLFNIARQGICGFEEPRINEGLAPEEKTVGIPPTDVALPVINLLPFVAVDDLLSPEDPREGVPIGRVELDERLQKVLMQPELRSHLVSVKLELLDLIVMRLLPEQSMHVLHLVVFLAVFEADLQGLPDEVEGLGREVILTHVQ